VLFSFSCTLFGTNWCYIWLPTARTVSSHIALPRSIVCPYDSDESHLNVMTFTANPGSPPSQVGSSRGSGSYSESSIWSLSGGQLIRTSKYFSTPVRNWNLTFLAQKLLGLNLMAVRPFFVNVVKLIQMSLWQNSSYNISRDLLQHRGWFPLHHICCFRPRLPSRCE